LEERSPSNPLKEFNQQAVDHLKRQPEWSSMIDYFATDKYRLQEAMLAGLPNERLQRLSAEASMADRYLSFALEKPEDEEGGL
jgi:hypothetical protein